ncbi:hypothetical protein [Paraclostridium sordellii]|uniref:hypothetical protein n=1 Tax=Paraclostridium sordellii TaxID=1505 RepID=UPI0005E5626D|nr:hypothetical protein [Paeniclostridium sordellii]CEQ14862.1 Uncharacterised protein [[Clostridium] sordellii] [Paeniclostridium sordellii]
MIKRFFKYNKFNEIANLKLIECKIAFLTTLILLFVFYKIKIYDEFKLFEPAVQNVAIYIAAALIGMLGIILAGIAFMTSSLNKENMESIEKINGSNSIEKVLVSFEFLAFLVGIQVIEFFTIYIILFSTLNLVGEITFYGLAALITYLFTFTLFYTVVLVGDSIQFFLLTRTYDKINEMDKSVVSIANEVKIDFILKILIENYGIEVEEITSKLIEHCENCTIDKKEDVITYLKNMYFEK